MIRYGPMALIGEIASNRRPPTSASSVHLARSFPRIVIDVCLPYRYHEMGARKEENRGVKITGFFHGIKFLKTMMCLIACFSDPGRALFKVIDS